MSDTVISARALSKYYYKGSVQRPDTLFGTAMTLVRNRLRPGSKTGAGEAPMTDNGFWALRDVDFDIRRGDVVGVVGRNGAGKSTLLKIISNITSPTRGEVTIKGRVGCLLEVGTGFSPDLSGRENIQLSAAILGMKRHEIDRRFDEIVDFADIPGFVDTPVKHYSSGMYMRLAFAVAAHLDHEILLVDEVLAVGDAAFQRKCQQKIGNEANSGRTILFVSHSLPAVAALCNRALYLEAGVLKLDERADTVLNAYQQSMSAGLVGLDTYDLSEQQHFGNGKARMETMTLRAKARSGATSEVLTTGGDLLIDLTIHATSPIESANAAVVVYDSSGYRIIDANLLIAGQALTMAAGDRRRVSFTLRDIRLRPGDYTIGLWLGRTSVEDIDGILQAVRFLVEADLEATRHSATFPGVYQCRFDAQVAGISEMV